PDLNRPRPPACGADRPVTRNPEAQRGGHILRNPDARPSHELCPFRRRLQVQHPLLRGVQTQRIVDLNHPRTVEVQVETQRLTQVSGAASQALLSMPLPTPLPHECPPPDALPTAPQA